MFWKKVKNAVTNLIPFLAKETKKVTIGAVESVAKDSIKGKLKGKLRK